MDDLFKSRGGRYYHPSMDFYVTADEPFQFVSDEDAQDYLADQDDRLERVTGETLDEALGGDVDDVVAAIDAGGWDDLLDFLLYAERQNEERTPVLEATVSRSETIKRQQSDADGAPTVDASTLTTSR